jgi:hypothetical protein
VLPAPGRDALIAGIAEALLIERALPELLDPAAHQVTVVISQIGATASAGGVAIAARALAADAWRDDGAMLTASGQLTDLPGGLPPHPWHCDRQVRDIALALRGLFVRAALAGEHGTWMIRATAAEPDVVRVELRSGVSAPPREVLRAHADARRELDRVLDAGGALPPNPDALLPVTRVLSYGPPLRPGEPYSVEIEDFATGWFARTATIDLEAAIRRTWHLAWSKQR